MKLNFQKNRTSILVSVILLAAIMGLLFIRTGDVSADKSLAAMSQSSLGAADSQELRLGDSPSVMPSLFRIISALVLVIGSIYGGLYLLKKMMGRKYSDSKNFGNLEILETIHIAPKKTVTLLRVGEKSILVGATDGAMSLLSELNQVETSKLLEKVETPAASDPFGDFLKSALAKVKEVTRKGSATAVETHR